MEWNRSETLALAAANCKHCEGTGLRPEEENSPKASSPCRCVLRAIFRACHERFMECASKHLDLSRNSLEYGSTHDMPGNWSRKNEEYVAEFLLIAKRNLTEEEHKIFRYRYLLGADWRLCCRKLKMDKGNFHHAVYRIQQKLGRVFRELEPYGLYPLRDYFTSGYRNRTPAKVVSIRPERPSLSELFPVKRAA
jgi:hypothetical protein